MAGHLSRAGAPALLGLSLVLASCSGGGTEPQPPRIATEVTTSPEFATVGVGESLVLMATARDSAGGVIGNAPFVWTPLPSTFASVTGAGASGTVSGIAPGAVRVSAQSGAASDTTWVAVLGPNSPLSTAFIDGRPSAAVVRGQIVSVPIRLNLSRLGLNGDLGTVQLELRYNPGLFVYHSATAGVSGTSSFTVPSAGTFRFSLDAAAAQGSADLTLVTVNFQVPPSAPTGSYTVLMLTYTAAPTRTNGQPYETPVTVWGRVRVE